MERSFCSLAGRWALRLSEGGIVSFSTNATKGPSLSKLALLSPHLVEVEFDNGQAFHLSAEFLRLQSPAADSKRRTVSGEKSVADYFQNADIHMVLGIKMWKRTVGENIVRRKVIAGRRSVGIMSMEQVGNYGIRMSFDDLHNTGIYSWDYLYHLGTNKFGLMREYLTTLKKHNLSRSPRGRS